MEERGTSPRTGGNVDARTALLAGTGTAVTIAIAMTCGVALSSASALADRPGTVLHGTAVVVPGSPEPTTTHADDGAPETVAAPAPKDIGETKHDDASAPETTAPVARSTEKKPTSGDSSAASKSTTSKGAAEKDASTSDSPPDGKADDEAPTGTHGSDDAASRTADGIAGFRERIRALIERWEQRQAERTAQIDDWRDQQTAKKSSVTPTKESSGSGHPRDRSGRQKGQSHRSPDDRD